jgi:hypothetical protein
MNSVHIVIFFYDYFLILPSHIYISKDPTQTEVRDFILCAAGAPSRMNIEEGNSGDSSTINSDVRGIWQACCTLQAG